MGRRIEEAKKQRDEEEQQCDFDRELFRAVEEEEEEDVFEWGCDFDHAEPPPQTAAAHDTPCAVGKRRLTKKQKAPTNPEVLGTSHQEKEETGQLRAVLGKGTEECTTTTQPNVRLRKKQSVAGSAKTTVAASAAVQQIAPEENGASSSAAASSTDRHESTQHSQPTSEEALVLEELRQKNGQEWCQRTPKEEVFASFWWEPRYVAKGNPVLKGKKFTEALFTKNNWMCGYAAVQPLIWYWSQVRIDTDDLRPRWQEHDSVAARVTTWIVIMLDFRFATGTPVMRPGMEESATEIGTLVKMFSEASLNILKRAATKVPVVRESRALANLGLPSTAAIQGRVSLLKPRAVNAVLFHWALLRLKEKVPFTWKFKSELSDKVQPLWKDGMDANKEIVFTKEAVKISPTHTLAKQLTEFAEEDKQRIQSLSRWNRPREEKRLIHNRGAIAEGWCIAPVIDWTMHGGGFTCVRCAQWVPCSTTKEREATDYFSWVYAKRKAKCTAATAAHSQRTG